MVIITVSSNREKLMLKRVKMLRRLLRKAFLRTNRARVMIELQEKIGRAVGRVQATIKHIEGTKLRQPMFLAHSQPNLFFIIRENRARP
jgi:hypothetical protein